MTEEQMKAELEEVFSKAHQMSLMNVQNNIDLIGEAFQKGISIGLKLRK